MGILKFLKSNNQNVKSIRIPTKIGDKYITLNLKQTYESLDILSLKIFQKDLYRMFDSDYGVICGRVLGNGGVGLPNCRVSIFVPLDEVTGSLNSLDELKKLETLSLYSYQNVYDKNSDGKIYNLLPKYSRNRNFNGFPDNEFGIGATPKTPVGIFPEKDEILINETQAYVYGKYLKYTTVTNESGDYILCVPSNRSYTINMSCDITDIGRFSTTPALLKLDGYSDSYFINETQINDEIDIERLPNIDIQNLSLFVKPLWSQNDQTEVGINRLDFNVNKTIKPFSTVIGNYFTQNKKSWWGDRIIFRFLYGLKNICFGNCTPDGNFWLLIGFRLYFDFGFAKFNEFIGITIGTSSSDIDRNEFGFCFGIRNILPFFSLQVFQNKMCSLSGGKSDLEPFGIYNLGKTDACDRAGAFKKLPSLSDDLFIKSHDRGEVDLKVFSIKNSVDDLQADILNNSTNDNDFSDFDYKTDITLLDKTKYITFQNNGNLIVLIPSNRKKVITNENGDLIPVDDNSKIGVFTEFRGYFYVTHLGNIDNPPSRFRTGKIAIKVPQFIDYSKSLVQWVFKHFKFESGKIYSFSQFNKVLYGGMDKNTEATDDDGFSFIELLTAYLINPLALLFAPPDTKGWDEQTNILFTGAYEETNDNVDLKPNLNLDTDSNKYTGLYNHITLLGIDNENAITPENFNYQDGDVAIVYPPKEFKRLIQEEFTFLFNDDYFGNGFAPVIPNTYITPPNYWGYNFSLPQNVELGSVSNQIIFTNVKDNAIVENTEIDSNNMFKLLITHMDKPSAVYGINNWIIEFRLINGSLVYKQVVDDLYLSATYYPKEQIGSFIYNNEPTDFYRTVLRFQIDPVYQSNIVSNSASGLLFMKIYNSDYPELAITRNYKFI